jgi:hypothetical protein
MNESFRWSDSLSLAFASLRTCDLSMMVEPVFASCSLSMENDKKVTMKRTITSRTTLKSTILMLRPPKPSDS